MDPQMIARVLAIRTSLSRPAPLAVGYEVTHRCNLDCRYCDRHAPLPHELSHDEIFAALEGLHRIGMRSISLDGGEPLIHPHIAEIVDWLVAHGVVVRMNSNGLLVTSRMDIVRRLAKLKISLDGTKAVNDQVRGKHAWNRAIEAAIAARDVGVPAEFTCVVGRHNASSASGLIELVGKLGFGVIFQPARESLFVGGHERAGYALANHEVCNALSRIEYHKLHGAPVLNGWSSLRHFRNFPADTSLPCAAGWINATLDPEGNLFHCGLVPRVDRSNNVIRLGAEQAFMRLSRRGCRQCWCARVVEENYAWGGRLDQMIPALAAIEVPRPPREAPCA